MIFNFIKKYKKEDEAMKKNVADQSPVVDTQSQNVVSKVENEEVESATDKAKKEKERKMKEKEEKERKKEKGCDEFVRYFESAYSKRAEF